MNADMEQTLDELGVGYREMVLWMRRHGEIEPGAINRKPVGGGFAFSAKYAVAAAIAIAICFVAVFTTTSRHPRSSQTSPYALAYGGAAATAEILRTQMADGSWGNDFLTRQNAAALRGVAAASVAYRKAVRYLRSRGLSPLTDAEFRSLAQLARLDRF